MTMHLSPNVSLTHKNTLGLKSTARYAAEIDRADRLGDLLDAAEQLQLPLKILGGGSNVILSETVDAVVGIMRILGRSVDKSTPGTTLVSAGAGENWHDLVAWTVEQGLPGLENLAGIPGTVGAAPVQNIGAYGAQLSDFFVSLEAFDTQTRKICRLGRDDCHFAYRQSMFKQDPGRYIIVSVTLGLPDNWKPLRNYQGLEKMDERADARSVMLGVLAMRNEKLPDWRTLGNAGSFFHNPVVSGETAARLDHAPKYPQADGRVKISAGWLIEQCGLKGERLGPVGTYDRHALIVVNHGGAGRADIDRFSALVRQRVRERFEIDLVQEPIAL